ncbi:N-methylhydantoinase (ATP-hydrolyzing) [[Actinomadura] parvosata subsp. kistnae]|uniref:Hydantoinase A/oxoprolinase domain-containing protein n=1 Tax=[Actinomadura] parvosata subsp. kistnae TaxID=1909395 RepID=A0A1U9ZU97_9ACTN|nr:hypothetical protein [Nonomuraea sp. ATCC 55076]AQZ61507.1 hypothetical protein BKM31_08485 [Nonomuraea sp. ATCC 55076]SPL98218.1 N-methylhydantoinase (ATP-hydrolyzing) [Actinomadura parvosata subsp. kistnae]
MILGVALGESAPAVVAVRDGAASWPVPRGVARTASRACVAADLGGVRPAAVAAIRVGGPCPEALRPVVEPGVATIVRGGHSVTGRPLAPLDTEAVRRFAATCGLADFAVTATGSPMLADHELEVAAIVAAEVPQARITLSYEFGYPGLREREADAIRNAALGPEAGRIADDVARELPGVPAYFARTGGGLVSAHYFRRFPLTCDRGAAASLARGRAALRERADAASGGGGDAGPGLAEVPDGVAAAYGAALGRPEAHVERIVLARGRAELDRVLRDARDEALTRVVSAGAAPGSAAIDEITVNPLSYLPDGLYRVRVTAGGRPWAG